MVYDKSQTTGQKKPRIRVEGKLIGMTGDSTKAKVFDSLAGKFSWLGISVVVGTNDDGTSIYKNITAYDIDLEKMPEFKKADELIRNKKKPMVTLECYETEVLAKDKEGKPMMEEVPEMRDGKEIVVQKQKVWNNLRMTADDVIKSFKILKEETEDFQPVEKVEEVVEEKVEG